MRDSKGGAGDSRLGQISKVASRVLGPEFDTLTRLK